MQFRITHTAAFRISVMKIKMILALRKCLSRLILKTGLHFLMD